MDHAQSVLVTGFNAGMAVGSSVGGTVLAGTESTSTLPWLSMGLFAGIAVLLASTARRSLPARAAALGAD